jgi:hypothetical protein
MKIESSSSTPYQVPDLIFLQLFSLVAISLPAYQAKRRNHSGIHPADVERETKIAVVQKMLLKTLPE